MAMIQLSPPARCGGELFDSQPRQWLTKRFANMPQISHVSGEPPPQSTSRKENFVEPQDVTALRC
jgi:hypothetical protein